MSVKYLVFSFTMAGHAALAKLASFRPSNGPWGTTTSETRPQFGGNHTGMEQKVSCRSAAIVPLNPCQLLGLWSEKMLIPRQTRSLSHTRAATAVTGKRLHWLQVHHMLLHHATSRWTAATWYSPSPISVAISQFLPFFSISSLYNVGSFIF